MLPAGVRRTRGPVRVRRGVCRRGDAGAVTPVRIIGAVSLMACVSYFVAMCILSPLGREGQMAMSSIAAAPVSVVLNLLLDGPFGAVGAGVALLATEATVLCIELWCARDVLSSFVRPRDLARMAVSSAVAVAVSAGCAWLLTTAFSAGPGAIAIAGLLVYSAVGIAVAVALRDDTALMLVGKARAALRRPLDIFGRPPRFSSDGDRTDWGRYARFRCSMIRLSGRISGN